MAERSTTTSPPQRSANAQHTGGPSETATAGTELHSGHRLAKRYRLEECITRLDGFSSWRAVDENLRRAVGIHVLPASHARAASVLSAARSASLLVDPRFVQVFDAVEEHDLVHVIHEWVPDATPLSSILHSAPLDAHEAYALASQLSQAMAAAHREGLAHLRLTPSTVMRTGPCQYRIRGLAVDAALRGITSQDPQRTDTEAVGALLYAALTQRWPYAQGCHGLSGVAELRKGSRESLAAPDQLRAGVHRGLSQLAMRALVNDGATAASHTPPFTTPEELSRALAALPRIPPPEQSPTRLAGGTTFQRGSYGRAPAASRTQPPAPPTLPGRAGTALKWAVSALLIAALGLGSWQLADALLKGDTATAEPERAAPDGGQRTEPRPIAVANVMDFDPFGTPTPEENREEAPNAVDGDPSTYWHTENYLGSYGQSFANLKSGVGLVLDLGEPRTVRSLHVEAIGETTVQFRAAAASTTETPTELDDFARIAQGTGESVTLRAQEPLETRFVLVWLTEIPQGDDENYRGRITEITVAT